jgi:hypothetical protein
LALSSLKGMGLSVLISNLGQEKATFSGQETNFEAKVFIMRRLF